MSPLPPSPMQFAHPGRAMRRGVPWLAALASATAAALIGAAVVLATFGPEVVDPRNPGWMLAGPLGPDPVQYWLGWTFFARSPWTLPPGFNPDYGLEIATSVFYADVIPLLALTFKALLGMVEVPQYWGLWLLGCGVAQALLGWRLLGLATGDPLARAAGAGLFVLQPMLLTRMGGHLALAGQWTLLAALWLVLRRDDGRGARQGAAWALLLLLTSLVHAYLLAMVLALWGADLLARAMRGPRPGKLALEVLAGIAAALLGLWAGGFFLLRSGHDAPGYGSLGMDLLAPLDPTEWGAFLPDIPDLEHGESGGSYLGLGALLLLALAGLVWARHPRPLLGPVLRRHWPLAAALLAMLAFAVTHRPALAGVQVTLFDPPGWALGLAGSLRASERFFWPLGYTLLAGAVALLARAIGGRRLGLLLAVLLVVQVADLRHGLARLHALSDAPREVSERLPDPFWDEAAGLYRQIRAVPAANRGKAWEPVARFAARHGLATDAVYLARIDPAAVEALRQAVAERLRSGRYEAGTLYVLRDAASLCLAARSHDPARDLLAEVDGLRVLAPSWFPARALPPGARRIGPEARSTSPHDCTG